MVCLMEQDSVDGDFLLQLFKLKNPILPEAVWVKQAVSWNFLFPKIKMKIQFLTKGTSEAAAPWLHHAPMYILWICSIMNCKSHSAKMVQSHKSTHIYKWMDIITRSLAGGGVGPMRCMYDMGNGATILLHCRQWQNSPWCESGQDFSLRLRSTGSWFSAGSFSWAPAFPVPLWRQLSWMG